jgi:hypothetical protein
MDPSSRNRCDVFGGFPQERSDKPLGLSRGEYARDPNFTERAKR